MSRRGLARQGKLIRVQHTMVEGELYSNNTKWYSSKKGNIKHLNESPEEKFFRRARQIAQRIRSHYHGK